MSFVFELLIGALFDFLYNPLRIGLLFLAGAAYHGYQRHTLWKDGYVTTAKVISVQKAENGLRRKQGPVVIDFVDNAGRQQQTQLYDSEISRWGVGDTISVRCHATDLKKCALNNQMSRYALTIVLFGFGLFFCGIALATHFFKPMVVGAGVLALVSIIIIFSALNRLYYAATFKSKMVVAEGTIEEFMYWKESVSTLRGATGLVVHRYWVRAHFLDDKGVQKVVMSCNEDLTKQPIGSKVAIHYHPPSLYTAQVDALPEVGYPKAIAILLAGVLAGAIAYMLFFKGPPV